MKRFTLFFACLFLSIGAALAQQKVVSGVVIGGDDNQPIIGASVVVKGLSGVGGQTNIDGKFSFQAPASAKTIVVSSVGYTSQEVAITSNMRIVLKPEAIALDDVVVVGYGTATKRSFTGSAVTVKGEELQKKAVSNVSQALSGEVPGVNIVNTSGQPGTQSDIYVRGVGSVNAGTAPLYVVDGVPFDGSVSAINPSDIESTTLLKDAAATSIYGARAANGVIVINTKSGKSGKMSVTAEVKYGVNMQLIPRHEVLTSPEEYIAMGWSGLKMLGYSQGKDEAASIALANKNIFGKAGINPSYKMWDVKDGADLIDPATGLVRAGVKRLYTPELWKDEAFQSSNRTEAGFQMGGGSNTVRAFASLGYLIDKGIYKNSDFRRMNGRINLNMNPYPWLTARANLAYTRSASNSAGQSKYSSTNLFNFIDNMPPIYPVYLRDVKNGKPENDYKVVDPYYGGFQYDFGNGRGYSGMSNGIATAMQETQYGVTNQVDFNVNANIRFLNDFTLENTYSGNYNNYFYKNRGSMWYGDPGNQHGTIYHMFRNIFSYDFLTLLRYKKMIDKHSLEAFVAHEASKYEYTRDDISKKYLIDPFVDDLTNALFDSSPASGYTKGYAIESYFAQANYNYANKYYVSGTFRRDGSSRFLNNKWGNFGSVGLAWVMSSEDFMKNQSLLKYLKWKTSFGTLGQQSGISYYAGYDLYDIGPLNGVGSLIFAGKGSPDLTWERANMFQIGAEFQLGNFLEGNVEYFLKNSSSLIYDRRVAPSNGYAIYQVNDGLLRNQGVDIDLTYHALKGKDYYFDIKLNAGFLQNKLTKMALDPSTGKPKVIDVQGLYGRAKGHSLYDYYIREYLGVNPDNGMSQWKVFYMDNDGDGKFAPKTNAQGEFLPGSDIPIQSLEKFKSENPNDVGKIQESMTERHDWATYHYVGKQALPVVRGAFVLSGGYKGIELSLQFLYGLGGYGYDGVYSALMNNATVGKNNWHVDMRKRWMSPGQKTDVPRLNHGLDKGSNATSTRFLTSNSFLNLANVRLGYNLPASVIEKMHMTGLNIWVSGDNLFLLSARRGFNPSTALTGGSSAYTYNPLSTVSAGLRMSF